METAVNISQSCNHFTASMKLHFLTARRDGESCKQTLDSLLKLLEGEGHVYVEFDDKTIKYHPCDVSTKIKDVSE